MSNLLVVLKDEVRRLARKEMRQGTRVLKRASAQHRRDIAGIKRSVASLEKHVSFLVSRERARVAKLEVSGELAEKSRFSPTWLAKHRKKLGLSAGDYAKLLGVSAQSVYHWEKGITKPRPGQVGAIAALRSIRKREAKQRLAVLAGKAVESV